MKYSKYVVLMLFSFSFLCAGSASAQQEDKLSYTNLDTFPNQAIQSLKNEMANSGYACSSDSYFTISEGDKKFKLYRLQEGKEYIIMNIPTESGLNDTDITIKDMLGKILIKDNKSQSSSRVSIVSTVTTDVRIWIKNDDSERRGHLYDNRLLVFNR